MSSVEFSDQPHPPDSVESLFSFGKLLARQKKFWFTINHPCWISFCKSADGHPTLHGLRHFPVTNGYVDIAVEIGTNYEKFGTLLLEDKKGNKVDSIAKSKHYIPVDITVEILKQWLQGKGRKPVTWKTLVKCLQDTNLNALADDMQSSLSEHDGSKNSHKAPSEEL